MFHQIFPPLLGFLLGSIPFGLLIAKSHGVNIREHGSGNIGATNVLRTIGKKAGYTCLLLDFLKGFIPVVIASNMVTYEGGNSPWPVISPLFDNAAVLPQLQTQLVPVITALCAVLGHNFSPWIGFKGGKGIATSGGVLLGLAPMLVPCLLVIWLLTFFITKYVSVASIAAAIALPIMTHLGARFHDRWADGTWNRPLFYFTLIVGLLAVWRHRSNIAKLFAGTEHKFTSKKK